MKHCIKIKVHKIIYNSQYNWRRKWQPTPVFLPGESPQAEELGRLQSIGSQSVGQD